MEDNFFDFAQTQEALSALSTELVGLETLLRAKEAQVKTRTQEFQKTIQTKTEQIASLHQTAQDALSQIETLSKYIEGVL